MVTYPMSIPSNNGLGGNLSAGELDLIGGHRAIDFVNTLAGSLDDPIEKLHTYTDLLAWCEHAGVLTALATGSLTDLAAQAPARAAATLAEVRRLRTDTDTVLRAHLTGGEPPAANLDRIREAHLNALKHAILAASGPRYEWTWRGPDDLSGPSWPLANDAVELLQSDRLGRLRICAECRWLFLDLSRNHSRRWCRMSGCGARAKMRRYRAARPVEPR
jgi:predicted RNA-binding Zn ribbon-like protein